MSIDAFPYSEWLASIDLSKTRIRKFPSFILLCGGEISNDNGKLKSCRDAFNQFISKKESDFKDSIILAEKTFSYFHNSSYKDLLLFEQDLAELCALTVIFSESPGSIAELGSFSVLRTIQDKLLVVMHKDHSGLESFIWQGPTSYLKNIAKKNKKDDPVNIYYWKQMSPDKEFLTIEDFSDADDLEERINGILSTIPKTELFDQTKRGHVMILIVGILEIFQLATADELLGILTKLSIQIDRERTKQYLSLLVSLGLLIKNRYGNNVYYINPDNGPWISWSYTKTAKEKEIDRWRSIILDHYSSNEISKRRALRSYIKSLDVEGK